MFYVSFMFLSRRWKKQRKIMAKTGLCLRVRRSWTRLGLRPK